MENFNIENLGYTPSTYQMNIFDFVVHGIGNAVIKARAGSGKTSTLVTAMKLIDKKKKCLFLAFNVSIKDELSKKLQDYPNCVVKTVHGLGFDIIRCNTHDKVEVNENKYITFLNQHHSNISDYDIPPARWNSYSRRIIDLLKFARLNMAQSAREIQKIADKHSIDIEFDEINMVMELMSYGKQHITSVDFTDMIWLPVECNMVNKVHKYDWIFNDEVQDYSITYLHLLKKCQKRACRMLSCGDEYQSINQFAGASLEAFNMLCNTEKTNIFTLPISYRCSQLIVNKVHHHVPDIQARENAELGLIKIDSSLDNIKVNDLVLSRHNAPLIKLYAELIDRNLPCQIKGQSDITEQLDNLVNSYASDDDLLSTNINEDGLFPRLYLELIREYINFIQHGMTESDAINTSTIQYLYNNILSLKVLAKHCVTVADLKNKIATIFKTNIQTENPEKVIWLSTIHKAKGLEADNVHIICSSQIPSQAKRTETERIQELNLQYVAYTRAKYRLFFVSEKEFPPMKCFDNNFDVIEEFEAIIQRLKKIYTDENFTIDVENIEIDETPIIDEVQKIEAPMIQIKTDTKQKLLNELFK